MANEKNLIPQAHKLTVEEASKGGQKSGESRRQKRLIKECMSDLLEIDTKDKKALKRLKDMGIEDKSNKMLITLGLFTAATYGDVKAFKEIRNLMGEDKRDMDLGRIDEIIGAIDDAAAE